MNQADRDKQAGHTLNTPSSVIHTLFTTGEYPIHLMKTKSLRMYLLAVAVIFLGGCIPRLGPVAISTADRSQGYPPLEVSFDGSASQPMDAPILSYHWDFGDGSTAGSAMTTHSFETRGTYSVILTVTDSDGLAGSTARTVQVLNRVPHADFRITPFGAPRDYPVQFDASESDDPDGIIVSYIWDFGDGASAEGINVEHIFPQQQTEYLVTLTVTDDSGSANSSIRKVVVLGCDTCG